MTFVLNGESRLVPDGLNIATLLKFLEIEGDRVAVELDRSIVRKPEWESAEVRDGAQVEVVWFVGGGSDIVSRSLRGCAIDPKPRRDDALALIEDAMNESRPGISDEQVRQELGCEKAR